MFIMCEKIIYLLYLQSATIGDRRVRILPLENMRDIPITSSDLENMDTQACFRFSIVDLIGYIRRTDEMHVTIWSAAYLCQ